MGDVRNPGARADFGAKGISNAFDLAFMVAPDSLGVRGTAEFPGGIVAVFLGPAAGGTAETIRPAEPEQQLATGFLGTELLFHIRQGAGTEAGDWRTEQAGRGVRGWEGGLASPFPILLRKTAPDCFGGQVGWGEGVAFFGALTQEGAPAFARGFGPAGRPSLGASARQACLAAGLFYDVPPGVQFGNLRITPKLLIFRPVLNARMKPT